MVGVGGPEGREVVLLLFVPRGAVVALLLLFSSDLP